MNSRGRFRHARIAATNTVNPGTAKRTEVERFECARLWITRIIRRIVERPLQHVSIVRINAIRFGYGRLQAKTMSNTVRRTEPLTAFTVSKADIKRIFERLSTLVEAERQQQAAGWIKSAAQSEEDFVKEREKVTTDAFRVTVTILGANGEELFGDNSQMFDSANVPETISRV
jgi:hypothetical protein